LINLNIANLLKRLKENDYTLNIPSIWWIPLRRKRRLILMRSKKEIEKIESELKIVKEEMRGYLEELGL